MAILLVILMVTADDLEAILVVTADDLEVEECSVR